MMITMLPDVVANTVADRSNDTLLFAPPSGDCRRDRATPNNNQKLVAPVQINIVHNIPRLLAVKSNQRLVAKQQTLPSALRWTVFRNPLQGLSSNAPKSPKRLFPLLGGPHQLSRDELPGFVIATAVREIAADFIQNNVEVSGRPLVKLLHEKARNEMKTNTPGEGQNVQAWAISPKSNSELVT